MNIQVSVQVTERGRKSPTYKIQDDLNGELTLIKFLEYTKDMLQTVALQVLREEQKDFNFDKDPLIRVDGRANKPLSAVDPLGRIQFIARASSAEFLKEIYQNILDRSPIDTGQYITSHYVFWNNIRIATNMVELEAFIKRGVEFKENDFVAFINIAPYARKLERFGVTAQRSKMRTVKSRDKRGRSGFNGRVLAANGTYFLTSRAVRRKYRGNAKIDFKFIPGSQLGLSAEFKTVRGQGKSPLEGKGKKDARTYLYPAIVVTFGARGFL